MQSARQLHVIDKTAAPGEQRWIFEPLNACAEKFRAHRSPLRSAAQTLRSIERRLNDAGITGAAAKVAG